MSDIDKLDMLPVGIRYSFWIVAIGKFILETGHLSADENLRMLKSIHSIPDELGYFNKEVLAMVQPASRAEYDIFDAAMKLGHNECFQSADLPRDVRHSSETQSLCSQGDRARGRKVEPTR